MKKLMMGFPQNKTFEEGFDEYILDCKVRNLRDGTIRHYKESIKQIYKRIPPDTLICSMNKKTVEKFYVALRDDKNLNEVSMGTYARDLKTLLRFFMKQGYLAQFDIALPKVEKQNIQTYSDDELRKLLKKPDVNKCIFSTYRSWVIVNFLLSTGIRQNSLIHIKISDIDFDNRLANINVTKNRKPLIIPLNEDICMILQEYLYYRRGNPDDWLFCSVYGQQLSKSSCYHALWDYCKERGLQQTGIHRFRHTFAKKWILMGGSVVTLQKVLGHSSLAITQNYINLLTTDLQHEMDDINIIRSLKKERVMMKYS